MGVIDGGRAVASAVADPVELAASRASDGRASQCPCRGVRGSARDCVFEQAGERPGAGLCQRRGRHRAISRAVGRGKPADRWKLVRRSAADHDATRCGARRTRPPNCPDHCCRPPSANPNGGDQRKSHCDTWHHTTSPVAPENFPTNRRRRVLCRAPTLRPNSSHARFTTHLGVGVRELATAHLAAGVRDLLPTRADGSGSVVRDSDSTPQRGVRRYELAAAAHGAGSLRVLIGIAPVGAGEFAGDTPVGAGEFAGDTPVGVDFRELAGIAYEPVRRIGDDTAQLSGRDVLCVAVTHLDDCRLDLDQVAVRALKAAPTLAPRASPEINRSTSRAVFRPTAAIHSRSVSGTTTRVSSLTADQFNCPERRASASSGNSSSASATRSFSSVARRRRPNNLSIYSPKLAYRDTRESWRETLATATPPRPYRAQPVSGEASTVPHAPAPTPPIRPRSTPLLPW